MNKQQYAVFLVGRPNTVYKLILHNLINTYKEIPIRILRTFHGIFQTKEKKMHLE